MDYMFDSLADLVWVFDPGLEWTVEVCALGPSLSMGFVWFGACLGVGSTRREREGCREKFVWRVL